MRNGDDDTIGNYRNRAVRLSVPEQPPVRRRRGRNIIRLPTGLRLRRRPPCIILTDEEEAEDEPIEIPLNSLMTCFTTIPFSTKPLRKWMMSLPRPFRKSNSILLHLLVTAKHHPDNRNDNRHDRGVVGSPTVWALICRSPRRPPSSAPTDDLARRTVIRRTVVAIRRRRRRRPRATPTRRATRGPRGKTVDA